MTSNERRCFSAPTAFRHKAYEQHRFKVEHATCAIDVNPPRSRPHVIRNAKGLQIEREKQERIMRENFILLKKLRDIMHRKPPTDETAHRLKWVESKCIRTR
ncbi:uncharacterized protein CFAP97D2 [Ceratina calcarata]|uniref:Uncharacterized protein CFAP97D2 n=1 Tax=Ceratina calcarata TaxID=156304 RepID=A0AAJ7IWJ8_9HYME|nr:uncharacterized protein CFAP97D2 [Ceratina calcarata]